MQKPYLQQVNLILDSPAYKIISCDIIYNFISTLLCSHESFLSFVLTSQYLKYLYTYLSLECSFFPSQSLIFLSGNILLQTENFPLENLIAPYSRYKLCQDLFVGKYLYFGLSFEVCFHLGIISLSILFFLSAL